MVEGLKNPRQPGETAKNEREYHTNLKHGFILFSAAKKS